VKLADWALAAPSQEFNGLCCGITQLVFEGLYVGAEEDLVSDEINDMAYTPHVALYGINAKLLGQEVEARPVPRGVVGNCIAEALSELIMVQNRHQLSR
jgi:hypothetical protein